jgi:SAM-dependent methyltransferase
MFHQYSDKIWGILSCPLCCHDIQKINSGAVCSHCQTEYSYSDSGALDFRLKKSKTYHLEFELTAPLFPPAGFDFKPLEPKSDPEVNFSGVSVPFHLSKELLSYFPKAKGKESLVLDLGCGDAVHREVCELSGFEYVGLDYLSPQAPLLGDAHSLPFKDESFEFILSIAVLEHIRFPFIMMREAYRVMKTKGKLIGTVSFLEPFHGDSFYHHTHLGVYNSLKFGGFKVEQIAPSEKWSVLRAQASMGLFPKMPQLLSAALVWPLQILSKLWWQAGSLITHKKAELDRICKTTGVFAFVAAKE